jgi:hypothetical protein
LCSVLVSPSILGYKWQVEEVILNIVGDVRLCWEENVEAEYVGSRKGASGSLLVVGNAIGWGDNISFPNGSLIGYYNSITTHRYH